MSGRLIANPFACYCIAFLVFVSPACGDEPAIKFDVPALIGVKEAIYVEGQIPLGDEKIIEVVIPVTSEVRSRDRGNVAEFRFDIYWNRSVYPVADYVPKTQTVSEIEGLISVEESNDKNAGLGINLSSGYHDVVSGIAKADVSQRTGTKTKYQEVPLHEVLVASGTVQRGTGAFFRFHPSRRETLEGGRDLVVAYRVPQSWRGGVLKVECRADGHRKVIGSWREPFNESLAFVLPIYLEGDDEARQAAISFVRSEQNLRINWKQHKAEETRPTSGLLGFATPSPKTIPDQWMHYLIQSGSDDYLAKYRSRLSPMLADAANDFVAARRDLLKFSR
ncbi:MAG: hypothetical protein P8J27_16925 [Mariniblastus sp.]|nr:hypothetical protein [Mariniblastus sp.]